MYRQKRRITSSNFLWVASLAVSIAVWMLTDRMWIGGTIWFVAALALSLQHNERS